MSSVRRFGEILSDQSAPLKRRFRALFALRNLGGVDAIKWISDNFDDPSALLKHELAYCLGQMGENVAIPILEALLANVDQEVIVRHEAGEALGAIGSLTSLPILEKFANDSNPEISTTCQLAVERIKWAKEKGENRVSPFNSVDPAPANSEVSDISKLSAILTNPKLPMWDRYNAMFSLRNLNSDAATLALAKALHCGDSALFRHEIAYVLGQVASPVAFDDLKLRLADVNENPMVRHECAEALGSIATPESTEVLREFLSDPERIVFESCQVALDMTDYETSGDFHLSDALLVSS